MPALATATLLLTGCQTVQPKPVCGTVVPIDQATQARAAVELRSLPAGSVIATTIVPDWIRQRDEARACAAAR